MENDKGNVQGSTKLFFSIKGIMWDPVNEH